MAKITKKEERQKLAEIEKMDQMLRQVNTNAPSTVEGVVEVIRVTPGLILLSPGVNTAVQAAIEKLLVKAKPSDTIDVVPVAGGGGFDVILSRPGAAWREKLIEDRGKPVTEVTGDATVMLEDIKARKERRLLEEQRLRIEQDKERERMAAKQEKQESRVQFQNTLAMMAGYTTWKKPAPPKPKLLPVVPITGKRRIMD